MVIIVGGAAYCTCTREQQIIEVRITREDEA